VSSINPVIVGKINPPRNINDHPSIPIQRKLFTKEIVIDVATDSQATIITKICTYFDFYPPRYETKTHHMEFQRLKL